MASLVFSKMVNDTIKANGGDYPRGLQSCLSQAKNAMDGLVSFKGKIIPVRVTINLLDGTATSDTGIITRGDVVLNGKCGAVAGGFIYMKLPGEKNWKVSFDEARLMSFGDYIRLEDDLVVVDGRTEDFYVAYDKALDLYAVAESKETLRSMLFDHFREHGIRLMTAQ